MNEKLSEKVDDTRDTVESLRADPSVSANSHTGRIDRCQAETDLHDQRARNDPSNK